MQSNTLGNSSIKSLTVVYFAIHRVTHDFKSDFAEGFRSLLAIASKRKLFRIGELKKKNIFFPLNL